MRRLLLTLLVVLTPVVAHADASVPTQDQASSSSLQSTGQTTSSPQTSSLLQPAETSGTALQSAGASGTGVAQSTVENLQQSGASDQTKLMIENSGDVPQALSNGPNLDWLLYILLVLIAASIGTGATLQWQRRTA
jgi:hypothetical protein